MKEIKLTCPKCGHQFMYKNYWAWVWKNKFHWLWFDKETGRIRDYRKTKCPNCNKISWIKKDK